MQDSKPDLSWASLSTEEIKSIVGKVKEKLKTYKEEIVKIDKDFLNFENLIHRGEVMSAEINRLEGGLFGYVNLHPDSKVQEVARKVELELSRILGEFVYDEEVYKQFLSYYTGNYKKEKKGLTTEQVKVVEDSNKGYKKIGMHLNKKAKKLLLSKKNKLNKLVQDFDLDHTKNYEKGLWFKKEELDGVSENLLQGLKFDEKKKKYFVSVRPTEITEVKKNCKVAKTRQQIVLVEEKGVGEKNNKRFREILKLRSEILKLVGGYKTWAEYSMSEEMMNKPEDVKSFLRQLINKLVPAANKKKAKLEKFLNTRGEKMTTSSYNFADTQLQREEKNVDENLYKPYFELNSVLEVLFNIWKNYFDVEVKLVAGEKVFDENTSVYSFVDLKSNKLLGHGVLDLFPRKLKYGHACVADIFKKYIDMNGDQHEGFTFLVCNFQKGKDATLLSFDDAVTLYHEAGHMLHMVLMKNNYIATSSTSRDFVEIPSQFHENFLTNKSFVKANFKHYQTGETMSDKLLDNLHKLGRQGEVIGWLRQISYATFDQELNNKNILKYTKDKTGITNLFEKVWKQIVSIPAFKERQFASNFSHLVAGYDAKYYSYIISKVYAQDFWYEFSKGGIKKGRASQMYKKFLEGANTRPEKELVKEFLGRKVSLKPFLEIIKD